MVWMGEGGVVLLGCWVEGEPAAYWAGWPGPVAAPGGPGEGQEGLWMAAGP